MVRQPCEHGRYEGHARPGATPTMILGSAGMVFDPEDICEGGTEPTDADLLGELVRRGLLGVGWYCWVAGGYADVEECRNIHPRRGCRPAYEMAVGVEVPMALWQPEWEPVGESEPPPGHPDSYPGVSPIPR